MAVTPSRRVKSLVGQQFGRLTVIAYAGLDQHNNALWQCQCACGKSHIVAGYTLTRGKSRSCGCLDQEARERPKKYRGADPENVFWRARQHLGGTLADVAECSGLAVETIRRLEDGAQKVIPPETRRKWNVFVTRYGCRQFAIPGRVAKFNASLVTVETRVCQNPECKRLFDFETARAKDGMHKGEFCSKKCAMWERRRPTYVLCAARCGRVITMRPSQLLKGGKPRTRFVCPRCRTSRSETLMFPPSIQIAPEQFQQLEAIRPFPDAPIPWADVADRLGLDERHGRDIPDALATFDKAAKAAIRK